MPKRLQLVVGLLVVVAGAACDKSTIDNYPPPIAIVPATDMITIKGGETFTAVQARNPSTTVQAAWSSDAPSVATIESSTGRATGISSGQATITAQYQTLSATRTVRVVPDYQGRWQGDWAVTTCTSDGDWLRGNICPSVYPTGSLWSITFVATQSRDTINGSIDFGDNAPGAVTGSIGMDGHLAIDGTYTNVFDGQPVEVTVSNCDTLSTDNQRMTGHFRVTLRASGIQGSVAVDGELHIVAKGITTSALSGRSGLVRALKFGGVRR